MDPDPRHTRAVIGGWLIYPAAYGAYTLIRGPIVDWRPYLYLCISPREQGCGSLIIGLVILTGVFAPTRRRRRCPW
ncbi:Pr6Pr family membrane protein [Nocardia nepalensis]|uniref:Pr6Pr family membrane protein n=1 Tax=Nocardia nepalensis TaxID=3375448 RepID=UPI003B67AA26